LINIPICFNKSTFSLENKIDMPSLIKSAIWKLNLSYSFYHISRYWPKNFIKKSNFILTFDHDINFHL
jgi:hypothetical protein